MDDAYLDDANLDDDVVVERAYALGVASSPDDPDHESSYPQLKARSPGSDEERLIRHAYEEGQGRPRSEAESGGLGGSLGDTRGNEAPGRTSNQEPDQPGYSTFSPDPSRTPSPTQRSSTLRRPQEVTRTGRAAPGPRSRP